MRGRAPTEPKKGLKQSKQTPVLRNNLVGLTPQPLRPYIRDAVLRGLAFSS